MCDGCHVSCLMDVMSHVVVGCSLCLTEDQIDLWVIHRGGLFIDLFVGYFLFFDLTRPVGFLIAGLFHTMNSQLFAISKMVLLQSCLLTLERANRSKIPTK